MLPGLNSESIRGDKPMYENIDLGSLIDQYEASEGYILRNFINDSGYLLKVHDGNYKEILSLIERYEVATTTSYGQSKAMIVDIGRVKSQEYLAEFLRLLHNYCASLYTIEQQYIEFLTGKRYKESAYNNNIGEAFKSLESDPKYLFLFAIRNYFVHKRIPDVQVSVQHKRAKDKKQGEILFTTRGRFTIEKSFFMSDMNKKFWGESGKYKSRLITNEEQLRILEAFIRHDTGHGLSVEIKDIICDYHNELHAHLTVINQAMISNEEDSYNESVSLIEEIKRRQDAIRG